MKMTILTKLWLPITILLFLLIALVVIGGNFYKPQELRKKASTPKNLAEIRLTPPSGQFPAAEGAKITLSTLLQNQPIDGIQIVFSVNGVTPENIMFTPETIPGMKLVASVKENIASAGAMLKIAYITESPSVPIKQSLITIGTLRALSGKGSMSVAFNQQLSKIMQNGTSTDILEFPDDATYSFIPITPTPEPLTCIRGVPLVSMNPTLAESFPGDETHYLVTLSNTDTAACPPTTFTFGPMLPEGWTMRNPNSLKVSPQNDTEFDISVTPVPSSRYGSYTVGLTVSGESPDQSSSVQSTHIVAEAPPYHFEFHVRLEGVTNASASGFLAKARFVKGDLDLITGPIAFHHLSGGVYSSGDVILADRRLIPGPGYTVIIKGEKHVARKFCKPAGQTEPCKSFESISIPAQSDIPVVFDLTGLTLDPGDLTPQDGKVDQKDIQAMKSLFGKACAAYTDSDKLIADLNYSGCIDSEDALLLRKTLQTRYDEN